MQSFFSTYFVKLLHALFGERPDIDDVAHLVLAIILGLFLLKILLNNIIQFFIFKHTNHRAQKALVKVGVGAGLETRGEGKTTIIEGLYNHRTVRLSLSEWRGQPGMALAAHCQAPTNLFLHIFPKRGWFSNAFVNVVTLRWQDWRKKEPGVARFLTGDPVFDEAYLIRSNQPDTALACITPEIRTDLVALHHPIRSDPNITITENEVRYVIQTNAFTAKSAKRLIEKLDLVCALAKAVENPRVKKLSLVNA